jgi:hypothetical protein
MDEHQAAVITAAIEQQEQENQRQAAKKVQSDDDSPLMKTEDARLKLKEFQGEVSRKDAAAHSQKNKANSQKGFAVDPALKVTVGIIEGVVGPKVTHEHRQQPTVDAFGIGKSDCTRCKKEYAITDGKAYKLCPHCRELQRQRSRRWQQKTKLKDGVCRRCGISIPVGQEKFVLCPPCRNSLRERKATRHENGRCVHCSGPNDSSEFKVCTRCRNIDKDRRKQLEADGKCNRCASELKPEDNGRKVCMNCRTRKKTVKPTTVAVSAVASNAESSTLDEISPQQQVQLAQHVQEMGAGMEANMFAQEQ